MGDQEKVDKPQDETQEEEIKEEGSSVEETASHQVEESPQEDKQTQFEEVEPMEEKTQVEAAEEKKSGGKGLVYLALIFAIVALVLSFWNAGVQRVVKEIENQEKVLESKTKALETTVNRVKAQTLLSQIQIEASKVYVLTMGERNYEGAAQVLATMEARINALKSYYPRETVDELAALVEALKKEVAKGPSPIPGLVAQIQSVSDRMMGVQKVAAVAPVEKAKPEQAGEKTRVEKAPKEKGKAAQMAPEKEKETSLKEAPKLKAAPEQAQTEKAPEEEGPFGGLLKGWSKLGEKLVGKE